MRATRSPQPKRLSGQVIVITGASSGIGLATAMMAARRGARVVLSSFDGEQLEDALVQVRRAAGTDERAHAVVADVTDAAAMERLGDEAMSRHGRIDTWVNNAGIHHFGWVVELPEEDARRIFEVNHWGVVHGCRTAVPRLHASGGGTIINVGSVLSARSVPLQGMYGASKHAMAAYTESLRLELRAKGSPIRVTLVRPGPMHTPIVEHSKSLLPFRVQLPPPVYHPDVAARGILHCAEHPRRDLVIGGVGRLAELGETVAPRLADAIMRLTFLPLQRTRGAPRRTDGLHAPMGGPARVVSEEPRRMLRRSMSGALATLRRAR